MPLSETVLILMLLLAIGMLAAGLFRRWPIPYTVLLVLIGLLLSGLATTVSWLHPLARFSLTPDLVLFIFLPTLIFESGFNLDARLLIKNLAPVLALAVPALLVSTFIVGLGTAQLLPIDLGVALVFGALISATDPVAVVALFKELGTPQRLTILVEGESLLNDATAIVLFNILLGIALRGQFEAGDVIIAIASFFKVFLGGVLIGVLLGWLFGWLMGRLRAGTSAVLILSLVMAYVSFIVAEHGLHVSGVMAVATGAVTLAVYGVPRLPRETGTALAETWEFLALACNTLLFLMIGFVVDIWHVLARWDVILSIVGLLLAARASMIYTLVPLTTRLFRLPRVSYGERHIMWWGGLKGGLAIAIVLAVPAELPGRQVLLDLTLGVVMFTLLVNAPTIRPLIAWLGLNRLTGEERAERAHAMEQARDRAQGSLQQLADAGILSRTSLRQSVHRLDEVLAGNGSDLSAAHRVRRFRLDALRRELLTLEDLYKGGVIQYYTFLDLKGELGRAREHVAGIDTEAPDAGKPVRNPFLRLEALLIRHLREMDWAAGLLSYYQDLRLSHHLLKDVARILMARAALDLIETDSTIDAEPRRELVEAYRRRLRRLLDAVRDIQRNYPDFYAGFESRLAMRTALITALHKVEDEALHGSLGSKPRARLEQALSLSLAGIAPVSARPPDLRARELLEMIPLFRGLDVEALDSIAARMSPVNYLAGDTVIGQGEHGDALYVVVRGGLHVARQSPDGNEEALGELRDGDFFGELALLGEQVRSASVIASRASSLLRLRRRDVLDLAVRYPHVEQRLEEVRAARQGE